jgi:predicted ABC-type exoprotein transport system permease subunit
MRKMFGILGGSTKLLVPKGKYRFQLLLLVAIGAAIPVTELLVAKLFTDLIVAGNSRPVLEIVISVVLFSLLFASTRIANYLQKTYRVKFFDKAFGADTREKSKTKESWEWAMGMELVNVLSFLTQLFVIAAFFFVLSPLFAALNMILILIVLQVMGVLFKRQLKKQRGFVEKKRAKKDVTPAERLGSRIQQAEIGTLLASFGVVLLLGVLIVFSLQGYVSLAKTWLAIK